MFIKRLRWVSFVSFLLIMFLFVYIRFSGSENLERCIQIHFRQYSSSCLLIIMLAVLFRLENRHYKRTWHLFVYIYQNNWNSNDFWHIWIFIDNLVCELVLMISLYFRKNCMILHLFQNIFFNSFRSFLLFNFTFSSTIKQKH